MSYSSIKLVENNVKKMMTVPSKWVMGDRCYFPRNKFLERKLSQMCADPEENWKEIAIEKELLRNSKLVGIPFNLLRF